MENIKSNAIKKIQLASEYKNYIIIAVLLFIIILISYNFSHSKRITNIMVEMEKIDSYVNIDTKLNGEKQREMRLCDFYIASAFRPYLGANQLFEYCDLKITRQVIKSGARCMYVDIFNSNLGHDAEPVISNGYKKGQWKLTFNTILFDDFCKLIAYSVFSYGYVNNPSDPFILMLNLNTEGNLNVLNKIKKIIYQRFGRYLLDNRYTYSSINIFNEPIKNFMKKIIIVSSLGYKNSELEELVNYTWDKEELKNITFESLDKNNLNPSVITLDPYELKQFNKSNATMVTPALDTIYTKNYDPLPFLANGCQFIMMNYQKIDMHFDEYISFFRKESFVEKPLSQRGNSNKKKPKLKASSSSGVNTDSNDPLNYQNEACPKIPSENPLEGVDMFTFKDTYSNYGLCFPSNGECHCDNVNQGDECYFDNLGLVSYGGKNYKLCCANRPIVQTNNIQDGSDVKSSLKFITKDKCTLSEPIEFTVSGKAEEYNLCDAHNNLIGNNKVCLIDKNSGSSCPTGWTLTHKIDNSNNKICCKD